MNYGMARIEHKEENVIGVCKECNHKNNTVYDNQLFVEAEEGLYHFSCYNMKVMKEDEEK